MTATSLPTARTAVYRTAKGWVLRVSGCEGLLYAATLAEAMDLAYRLASSC